MGPLRQRGPADSGHAAVLALGLPYDADLATAFDCATAAPRRIFGHDDRGIAVGAPADLFTVHAETLAEAVAQHPPRGLVFKAGRLVGATGPRVNCGSRAK